jgi:hypothetical protein
MLPRILYGAQYDRMCVVQVLLTIFTFRTVIEDGLNPLVVHALDDRSARSDAFPSAELPKYRSSDESIDGQSHAKGPQYPFGSKTDQTRIRDGRKQKAGAFQLLVTAKFEGQFGVLKVQHEAQR